MKIMSWYQCQMWKEIKKITECDIQVYYIRYSLPKLKSGLSQRQLGCLSLNGLLQSSWVTGETSSVLFSFSLEDFINVS